MNLVVFCCVALASVANASPASLRSLRSRAEWGAAIACARKHCPDNLQECVEDQVCQTKLECAKACSPGDLDCFTACFGEHEVKPAKCSLGCGSPRPGNPEYGACLDDCYYSYFNGELVNDATVGYVFCHLVQYHCDRPGLLDMATSALTEPTANEMTPELDDDEETCQALSNDTTCDANDICSWCKSAAVKPGCHSLANAERLPAGVFECSKMDATNEFPAMTVSMAGTAPMCDDNDKAAIKAKWGEFNGFAEGCAKSCFFKSDCTAKCIVDKTSGMSQDCGSCFGTGATCVAKNCAMKCLLNPSSKSCCDCARTSCKAGMESCSGLVAGDSYPHCDG